MTAPPFTSLRELVLHHAARRGWHTQRQIAVFCGLDESALSRLLNGEQDIGAWRTHALFRAVGIPVEQYDLAYALLGQARSAAAQTAQKPHGATITPSHPSRLDPRSLLRTATMTEPPRAPVASARSDQPPTELPIAVVLAHFAARRLSGAQIAAFFEQELAG